MIRRDYILRMVEEFVQALARIRRTAERHGVAAGIHTSDHEMCGRRLAQGFRFMAIASDARFMVAGGQAELSRTPVPERPQEGGKQEEGKEVLRY